MNRIILSIVGFVAFFATFFATGGAIYGAPLALLAAIGAVEVTERIIVAVSR